MREARASRKILHRAEAVSSAGAEDRREFNQGPQRSDWQAEERHWRRGADGTRADGQRWLPVARR